MMEFYGLKVILRDEIRSQLKNPLQLIKLNYKIKDFNIKLCWSCINYSFAGTLTDSPKRF